MRIVILSSERYECWTCLCVCGFIVQRCKFSRTSVCTLNLRLGFELQWSHLNPTGSAASYLRGRQVYLIAERVLYFVVEILREKGLVDVPPLSEYYRNVSTYSACSLILQYVTRISREASNSMLLIWFFWCVLLRSLVSTMDPVAGYRE